MWIMGIVFNLCNDGELEMLGFIDRLVVGSHRIIYLVRIKDCCIVVFSYIFYIGCFNLSIQKTI